MKELLKQLESTTNSALVELKKLYDDYDYAKWRGTVYDTELDFMKDHPSWIPGMTKEKLIDYSSDFGTKTDTYLEIIAELEPIVEYLEKALAAARDNADILLQNETKSEDKDE